VFVCVARYKYLTPTEPAAGFDRVFSTTFYRSNSLEAPADLLPDLYRYRKNFSIS
jgi:hypothetical protein